MKNRLRILLTIAIAASFAACSSAPNLTQSSDDSSITDLINGDTNLGEVVDATDNTPAIIDLGLNASIPGWTGVNVAFDDPKEVEYAKSITTDSNGNVIVAGTGSGEFGPQTNFQFTHPQNMLLTKLNAGGTRLWTRTLGSSNQSQPQNAALDRVTVTAGVVTDPSGNIYVAGYTATTLNGQSNAGMRDAFLIKYNPNGVVVWTRLFGAAADDGATGIAINGTNIYLTGYACGNGFSFLGNTIRGACDVFVTKYESNGNRSWAKLYGSSGNDLAAKIAKVSSGGAVLVGSYQGPLDDNGYALNSDGFVIRIDPNGNVIWNLTIATPKSEEALAVTVSSDAVYVGGNTLGNLNGVPRLRTGSYKGDAFLVKASLNAGVTQWTRYVGSSAIFATTTWARVTDLALNANGQLFVFGDGFNSSIEDTDVAWPVRYDAAGNRNADAGTYANGSTGDVAMAVGMVGVFLTRDFSTYPGTPNGELFKVSVVKFGFDLKQK